MIAAYQRISRADGDLGKDGKDKSNSIRDFYDTAGGRQRDRASGTGGSNASAGMVHIK